MPLIPKFNRQGFKIVTVSLSMRSGMLTKQSAVSFTYGPGKLPATLLKALAEGAKTHGGKIGMRIGKRQRVKSFEVAGSVLRPSAALAREFTRVFGAAPHEKWVAFPIGGQRAMLMSRVASVLKISFRASPRRAFQLVPMVVAFGNQDLAKHHVLGVTVLKGGKPTVDTFVEVVS